MTFRVEVRVAVDSRWRVGTGTSSRGLDDETWSDAGGHVTIPASHLKRRLRERAEWLCDVRGVPRCRGRIAGVAEADGGDEDAFASACSGGDDACLTCLIFGSPRVEPGWRFEPAVLLRPDVPDPDVLREAERAQVVHNRIDPWARRSSGDLLFTLEAARSGLEYNTSAVFLWPGEPPEEEVGLLVAAVGALEAVGGRKNRGYGECRAWVLDRPGGRGHDDWIGRFLELTAGGDG